MGDLWVATGERFSLQKSHSRDSHSDLCALPQTRRHKYMHEKYTFNLKHVKKR